MARLPIDLMTATDRANLPSGKMVVERATAADFGGQVGAAVAGLADVGMKLAVKLQENEKKVKEFGYEKQFSDLQEQDNLAYDTRLRNVSGTADGHWQGAREETQTRFGEWLKTLPPQARAEYEARAQQFQTRRTAQAFRDQYQQQDASTRIVLTEEQRKAGVAVQQQPQSYEQFLADQERLIDASPLTPIEKQQRKAEVRNGLAVTAAQAEAQQNPAGVVAAGVGGGFRESLRERESGGNDSAAAGTSSALGRYQFLRDTWNLFAGSAGVPPVQRGEEGGPNDPRLNPQWQEKVLDQYIASSTAKLRAQNLPITDANLYVLHFLGQEGGAKFLRELQRDAGASAATLFPDAAKANRSIFFARNEPRTLSDVYANLTRTFNGAGVTPGARSAAQQNLTAEQNAAVMEGAQRTIAARQQLADAEAQARAAEQRNSLYIGLKEGPTPEADYREARRNGLLSSFEDIQKAEGIMQSRQKADADFQTGVSLMQGGRTVANQFDKSHRDGISALYERGVKNGMDPAAIAAAVFDRTGIVPPEFATALRGALASEDQTRVGASLVTAANMLRQNPNAFSGVDGGSSLEKSAFEFRRLTETLGLSTEQAAARVIKDARDPALLDPVKQEQMQQFRKSALTQEKIDSRLQSKFASGWFGFGAPSLPTGPQRTALASIYSEFAEEGFQQFRDPTKAMEFADLRVQQQFGVQSGVLTRYPPAKAGLPALPGAKDGHAWINEQAAQIVKERLGVVVEPSQIVLLPVERDGASTSAAFRGQSMTVKRNDSKPGQETSYQSVPYMVQVLPKTPEQEILTLNGAFFPDIDTYVAGKNKALDAENPGPLVAYDQFGLPYEVAPHQVEYLKTPEQEARRVKAEKEAELRAAQEAERARRAAAKKKAGPPNITTADEALAFQHLQGMILGADGNFRRGGQ